MVRSRVARSVSPTSSKRDAMRSVQIEPSATALARIPQGP
jgi:hypothetical protein